MESRESSNKERGGKISPAYFGCPPPLSTSLFRVRSWAEVREPGQDELPTPIEVIHERGIDYHSTSQLARWEIHCMPKSFPPLGVLPQICCSCFVLEWIVQDCFKYRELGFSLNRFCSLPSVFGLLLGSCIHSQLLPLPLTALLLARTTCSSSTLS